MKIGDMLCEEEVRVPGSPPETPLAEWIETFAKSAEYKAVVQRIEACGGYITDPSETALMYGVIQHLRRSCLEIGTLAAHTSRIMAEAIVEAGSGASLVTLDPFGADRVPPILRQWPEPLQRVTDFRPWNSMQYFLELETLGTAKGTDSSLGVVFVDGHHNFEYAFFDIIRSADHLMPGGAIFVDNLERQGPCDAALEFLRRNPAWRLFYQGRIWGQNIDEGIFVAEEVLQARWGVLLSPEGIQIAKSYSKFVKRGLPSSTLGAIRFNPLRASGSGTLLVNFCYYSVPYDFHITATGIRRIRRRASCNVTSDIGSATIEFPEPLSLGQEGGRNICLDMEVSYRDTASDRAFMILDPREPFSLLE